jgi:hypothetical protein
MGSWTAPLLLFSTYVLQSLRTKDCVSSEVQKEQQINRTSSCCAEKTGCEQRIAEGTADPNVLVTRPRLAAQPAEVVRALHAVHVVLRADEDERRVKATGSARKRPGFTQALSAKEKDTTRIQPSLHEWKVVESAVPLMMGTLQFGHFLLCAASSSCNDKDTRVRAQNQRRQENEHEVTSVALSAESPSPAPKARQTTFKSMKLNADSKHKAEHSQRDEACNEPAFSRCNEAQR